MSSVYVLEPPTRGKVVLHTTYGPIDIELWPKEAPKTVRNFVQLCLECYYDNTIFHRVIKSFLVQGGDPTGSGSGTGGESIYGGVFPDEFHSRLRFKHRGLVASANAGSSDSNGSQFFITLDRCDWLDKKNTIFGKVTGDSVFNLLHLGEVETDKNDRPLDPPPRILSVEVLWNPFDDIVTRKVSGKLLSSSLADDVEVKDQKKKGVKKLNLLSFGEEAEEEEKELATVKEKIKSSHDVLNDPRLLKEPSEKEQNLSEVKDMQRFFREALTKRDVGEKEADTNLSDINDLTDDEDEAKFDERMRLQILKKRKELGDIPTVEKSSTEKKSLKERRSPPPRVKSEDLESIPKKEKLSLKKKGIGSEARAEQMSKADGDLQLLGQAEQERYMHKQRKRRVQGREEETLARLQNFKKALSSNTVQNSEPGVGDEEGESGWFSNKLKFLSDPSNKDAMSRKDDPNEYLVHDPLLEKGKEKFNKTQAKLKRREREWAGKSLT